MAASGVKTVNDIGFLKADHFAANLIDITRMSVTETTEDDVVDLSPAVDSYTTSLSSSFIKENNDIIQFHLAVQADKCNAHQDCII